MNSTDDLAIQFHDSTNKFVADCRHFQIIMSSEVCSAIEKYASSDTSKELGGIILGRQMEDGADRFIVVEGHVEAKFTEAQRGSVTFTHQSWDQMHSEREARFPGQKIVGWFHTHPGFGIFLSSYDLFIHKSFFDLPWQLAYVVDPLAGERGFFRWEGADIVKAPFKLMKEPGEKLDSERSGVIHRHNMIQPPTGLGWKSKTAVTAASILFIASVALFMKSGNVTPQSETVNTTKNSLEISTKQSIADKNANANLPPILYRVRPGDNLEGLCWSLLGDISRVTEVATRNNINNPNIIEEGQTIVFPPPSR